MPIYKDKKRNTWYFRAYIKDIYGTKKQVCRSGFATKSEAKLAENSYISNMSKNYCDFLFIDLYEEYLRYKMQIIKPQSIVTIKNRFEKHILPFFKDYKLKDINHNTYIKWKEQIINQNYSYKYNSNLHGCMVSILNYAIDFYGLDKNIASKVGNFTKDTDIKEYNFWTYEEFYNFISSVDELVFKVLFRTLYFTGMRLGECLALNWNDIDGDFINIKKTISQKAKINGIHRITTPKSKSSNRKIKIDMETLKQLNNLKEYYKSFIGFNNNWFVFGGLKPLAPTTISRKKDFYCKISNTKRIKIHDFRHSHATTLISSGIPITVISSRLGHHDISMTLKVYSHLIPKDEEKVIDFINDLERRQN